MTIAIQLLLLLQQFTLRITSITRIQRDLRLQDLQRQSIIRLPQQLLRLIT